MSDTGITDIPYRKTEDYKRYRREYMKNWRKASKAEDITPLRKKNERSIKDTTKKQYIAIILRLHSKFTPLLNSDLETYLIKIFDNEINEYTYKYIKRTLNYVNFNFADNLKKIYTNPNSLKANLIPYITLLSFLTDNNYFKKVYNFTSKYAIDLNKEYENARDDNVVAEEDKDKIIIDYDIGTLKENIEVLDNVYEKLIFALYTFIPPRRLEYSKIFIDTLKGKHRHNKEDNFLILNKKKPMKFIFRDYKTKEAYGTQEILIPDDLADVILDYLKVYGKKTGDMFIDVSANNLGKQIKKVFAKVYDKDISLRWLRISYATFIQSLNISNNEKNEMILQMGHNASQSQKYKKIID